MGALLAAVSLAAWLYLFFAREGFWHADQRLAREVPLVAGWPSVVAIVPARNEAATIGPCIRALAAQRYPGSFRIVLVDDSSSDETAALARAAALSERLTVIAAPPLAQGWTGKLWALSAGLEHGSTSGWAPAFYWFTDADVVHAPETLARLVAKALHTRKDLVSLMVKLHCRHAWERLLIPAFIYFFQMLYPFRAVNNDQSTTAAAAGGCVLIKREALIAAGGLVPIRGAIIDDCALASLVKRSGSRLWIGLADDSVSLREALGLGPLWAMVKRTAFTQLKCSIPLLIGTILALALIFIAPMAIVLALPWHGSMPATVIGLAACILMILSYVPTIRDHGQPYWGTLLLPVAAMFYGAMTVASAFAHWRREGRAWKGRTYGGLGL